MSRNKKITFILPTKDRVNQLKIFFQYHSKILNKIPHNFLVVDASNNSNHLKNNKNLKLYKNIEIFRQKTKGIQMGCIEAIPYIKTKYSTFLYDDDYLGKNVIDIYKKNMSNPEIFSLGCGIVQDIKTKVKFNKLKYIVFDKYDILSCYYGSNFKKKLNLKSIYSKNILPVSPICTSFETKFLFKWKKILMNFTKKNKFRKFFFFKKDVGPDMLIYLMQLDSSNNKVNFYYPYSVKFSSHSDSISIIYGNPFLRIGYWLSRICFFNNKKFTKKDLQNNFYTYLMIIGVILIISNLNNYYYFKNICNEVFKLLKTKNTFSYKYFFTYIYERVFQ